MHSILNIDICFIFIAVDHNVKFMVHLKLKKMVKILPYCTHTECSRVKLVYFREFIYGRKER